MNELFLSGGQDKYKFYRNKILQLSRISEKHFITAILRETYAR